MNIAGTSSHQILANRLKCNWKHAKRKKTSIEEANPTDVLSLWGNDFLTVLPWGLSHWNACTMSRVLQGEIVLLGFPKLSGFGTSTNRRSFLKNVAYRTKTAEEHRGSYGGSPQERAAVPTYLASQTHAGFHQRSGIYWTTDITSDLWI